MVMPSGRTPSGAASLCGWATSVMTEVCANEVDVLQSFQPVFASTCASFADVVLCRDPLHLFPIDVSCH